MTRSENGVRSVAYAVVLGKLLLPVLATSGCGGASDRGGAAAPKHEERTESRERIIPFVVSPDDSMLTVAERKFSEITVVDTATGQGEALEPPPSGDRFIPLEWGPDSAALAGVWRNDGEPDGTDDAGIAAVSLHSGGLRKLTTRGQGSYVDWWPTWSPSGRWIAFERLETLTGPLTLYVVKSDGGPLLRVSSARDDLTPSSHGGFCWDASRDVLHFCVKPRDGSANLELCSVTMGTEGPGSVRRMSLDALGLPDRLIPCRVLRSPAEGTALLSVGGPGLLTSYWIVDLGLKQPPRLLRESDASSGAAWCRALGLTHGRRALFVRGVDGADSLELFEHDAATGVETPLISMPLSRARHSTMYMSGGGRFIYWGDPEAGTVMRTSVRKWQPEVLYLRPDTE